MRSRHHESHEPFQPEPCAGFEVGEEIHFAGPRRPGKEGVGFQLRQSHDPDHRRGREPVAEDSGVERSEVVHGIPERVLVFVVGVLLCLGFGVKAEEMQRVAPRSVAAEDIVSGLHGADLHGADLHGVDLHGAGLHGASLHAPGGSAKIFLRGGIFDPIREYLDFEALGFARAIPGRYGLVQVRPGLDAADADWQNVPGVEVLGYLPQDAYQVRWTEEARRRLAEHADIRWLGEIPPGSKVAPRLWPGAESGERGPTSAAALKGAAREARIALTIMVFRGEALEETLSDLADSFPGLRILMTAGRAPRPFARLELGASQIDAFVLSASAKEAVSWIEPWHLPRTLNSATSTVVQANVDPALGSQSPIWDQDILGTGEIIAIADTGVDRNGCWFREHNDGTTLTALVTQAEATLPPVAGTIFPQHKVVGYWNMPGAADYDDPMCHAALAYGHGTHISATVAGDCAPISTPTDIGPPPALGIPADGMAPNAQILVQDLGTGTDCLAGLTHLDLGDLIRQGHDGGAHLHLYAWGADNASAYSVMDQQIDDALWSLESDLVIAAAGDLLASASPPPGLTSPGTAKNVLTVGALGQGFSTVPASFSPSGPTLDQRLKPDVMAPGSQILSAESDGDDINPSVLDQEIAQSGTSQAAAVVTGAAAMVRQYFRDGFYPSGQAQSADRLEPPGALVKAMLAGSTAPITPTMPSFDGGWGRVFLDNNLHFAGDGRRTRVWSKPHAAGLLTGDVDTYTITVPAGAVEMRVTLAWLDPAPLMSSAVSLVNDLHLVVSGPGANFLGNDFSGGHSVAGGFNPDRVNTLEQVRLAAPTAGTYTLSVHGASIPGNGYRLSHRQGYALVASFEEAGTAITSAPGALLAGDNSFTGIDLSYAPVSGATGYNIYRATGNCSTVDPEDFQLVGHTTGLIFTDLKVEGGQDYAYQVRAVSDCCEGPPSGCSGDTTSVWTLCGADPPGSPPRPLWSEIDPSSIPDYDTLTQTFAHVPSLRVLQSMMSKSMLEIGALESQVDVAESRGRCVCGPSSVFLNRTRAQCQALAHATTCPSPVWLPLSGLLDDQGQELFAVKLVDALDATPAFLGSALQAVLSIIGTGLANQAEIDDVVDQHIDAYTSGNTIGAYSSLRPALRRCIPYVGAETSIPFMKLLGGKVSFETLFDSENLSRDHRLQQRANAVKIKAFGREFTPISATSLNFQLEDSRLWDAGRALGADFGNPISAGQIDDIDIFHLTDATGLAPFDSPSTGVGNSDSLLSAFELGIPDRFPLAYSPASGGPQTWPRPGVNPNLEEPSVASFSAGRDLRLDFEPFSRSLATIPIGSIFTLVPTLSLDLDLGWRHGDNLLRDRIQDQVNKNLPAHLQLGADDFMRDMHDFQGPDVTEDNGNSALVEPGVSATLNAGLKLGKRIMIGVGATLGVEHAIEPSSDSGVADLNRELKDVMMGSHAVDDLPCEPIWTKERESFCSNTLWRPLSTAVYNCGEAGGEECGAHGFCTSTDGQVFLFDLTKAQCDAYENVFFVPYSCTERVKSVIADWQGAGCHPLTHGFPSVCACTSDLECAAGETCVSGRCEDASGPVACECTSDADCNGPERWCHEGACVVHCSGGCPDGQTCELTTGACVDDSQQPFAEQIVWRMENTPAPMHSVFTYALADLETSTSLNFVLNLGLSVRIFGRTFGKTLLEFSDSWPLAGSTDTKFQIGLEAEYQDDCSPQFGQVSNRQPSLGSSPGASRYNPSGQVWNPGDLPGAFTGNGGTLGDLVHWCDATLPLDVADPPVPAFTDLENDLYDLVSWSEEIGQDVWANGRRACAGEVNLLEWLAGMENSPEELVCRYDDGQGVHTFPCAQTDRELLQIWGCTSISLGPPAAALAADFPGAVITLASGDQVFDLAQLLVDPTGEVELANLKPAVAAHPMATAWVATLRNCFEPRWANVGDELSLEADDFGPCCGNGVVNEPEECDYGGADAGACTDLCQWADDVEGADLWIEKEASASEVFPGCAYSYTVVVKNHGPEDAENVTVLEVPGAGIVLTGFEGCDLVAGVTDCFLGTIPVGGERVITVYATAASGFDSVTNEVFVTSTTPDPVEGGERASVGVTVSHGSVFCDGFESGSTSAWTSTFH